MAGGHALVLLVSMFLVVIIRSVAQSTSSDQQKTAGVPDIQGSPCRNGAQGRDGRDGRDGEKGGIGIKGDKGDTGVAGLRGREGTKGEKGEKGERGIAGPVGAKGGSGKRGPDGPKGLTGMRGLKGDKGTQGRSVRVQDLDETVQSAVENKLEDFNSTMMSQIEQLKQSLLNHPAAHLSGNSVSGYHSSGTVTQWKSSSGSVWSPYLRGGMQYSNGYITVPQHGLYYVYAQMFYLHASSSYREAGYYINVNGSYRAQAYRSIYTQDIGVSQTHYMGRIISLNKGDRLSLSFTHHCHYYFNNRLSFLGAFKVS